MKTTVNTNMTPKEYARIIATQLIEVATEFLKSNILPMPAGTYTAGDFHRHFNKECKNYVPKNIVPTTLFKKNKPIDLTEFKTIEHELGTVSFPWYLVFYYLWRFEKEAGWTGKKAHKFICRDPRKPIIESSIVFGCEKQIRKLSRMVSQFNVTDRKHCMLSLADGCISGTFSKQVWVNAKRTTQEYGGFTLTPTAFDVNPEVANLSVRITAAQLKHLYGECTIRIYKDEVPNGNADNPYRIQVMIENPDGWIIGSDIIEGTWADISQECNDHTEEVEYNPPAGTVRRDSTTKYNMYVNVETTSVSHTEENASFMQTVGFHISSNQPENKFPWWQPVETTTNPFRPDTYMPDDFRILSHLTPPPLTQPSVYPLSEKRVRIPMCSRMYIEHSVKNLLKSRTSNE